jgi:4-hydroxybenzoate polyprenyltransferase/phosphoserine phosphatase
VNQMVEQFPTNALPLCVDLDGTLITTDSLHEAFAVAATDPQALFGAAQRLVQGKAAFKQAIYARAELQAAHLPYNAEFLEYLKAQRAAGRTMILVTAADRRIADAVSAHLGLFDEVLSSDGAVNLRGQAKADRLVERFGERGFAYAGNDHTDVHVWQRAGAAVLVGVPSAVAAKVTTLVPIEAQFLRPALRLQHVIRAMRPHQWAKNVLVFLPIVVSTGLLDLRAWIATAILFVSFCCAASSIYLFNDLTDLNADRSHPRKRNRPIAQGVLSVKAAMLISLALAATALLLAAPIGGVFIVLGYAALSTSYSFVLKEKALVDVFVLAGLYTTRVVAGGIISGHKATDWLIVFAIFAFLSLALAKRVAELVGTRARASGQKLNRRAYSDQDIPILQLFGVASGVVATVVLALYLQSLAAHSLYAHPTYLLIVVVIVLFWFCRVWLQTARGEMHDDPLVWAIKDRASIVLGVFVAAAMIAAVG